MLKHLESNSTEAAGRGFVGQFNAPRASQMKCVPAGEVACADTVVPVWRVAAEMAEMLNFTGKFVRYSDMPVEMEKDFRAQQILAGRPFDGAAYVEDFQLFADLNVRRR